MAFRVYFSFDDGSYEDMLDETFETEEEAKSEARQAASDYSQGRDYLIEAGEDYSDKEIVSWDIVEE